MNRRSGSGKGTSGMHRVRSGVIALSQKLVCMVFSTGGEGKEHTRVKKRVHTQVYSHAKLEDSECIKSACDPPILPGYRVNSQAEDGMGDECDGCKIDDFKEHRPFATVVRGWVEFEKTEFG